MQIMLGMLLFVGVIIMVTLIFIGYFLYANSKRTAAINDMLASKEADLVDLYDSLEQMMEEIEQYTQESKQEMQADMDKIREMYDAIQTSPAKEKEPEIEEPDSKLVPLNDKLQMEREKLMKRYEKCVDLKGSKVRAFYNKGVPVADIAREMGIGQGEVQLILNLKNKII